MKRIFVIIAITVLPFSQSFATWSLEDARARVEYLGPTPGVSDGSPCRYHRQISDGAGLVLQATAAGLDWAFGTRGGVQVFSLAIQATDYLNDGGWRCFENECLLGVVFYQEHFTITDPETGDPLILISRRFEPVKLGMCIQYFRPQYMFTGDKCNNGRFCAGLPLNLNVLFGFGI